MAIPKILKFLVCHVTKFAKTAKFAEKMEKWKKQTINQTPTKCLFWRDPLI